MRNKGWAKPQHKQFRDMSDAEVAERLGRGEEGSAPKLPEVGQTPASRMQAVGTRVAAAFLPALGVCRRKRGEAIGETTG